MYCRLINFLFYEVDQNQLFSVLTETKLRIKTCAETENETRCEYTISTKTETETPISDVKNSLIMCATRQSHKMTYRRRV